MGNINNLTPFSATENRDRTVAMAKLGGAASVKSRRARKTFKDEIKMALDSRIQPSHVKYAEIKRMLRSVGLLDEGDPTNQLIIIAGMLQRAQRDPAAAAFLRDTIGEKPKDEVDVAVNAPPIVIGIHDREFIEAERKRQDRMLKDMAGAEVVDVEAETDADGGVPAALPAPDGGKDPSGTDGHADAGSGGGTEASSAESAPGDPEPPSPPAPPISTQTAEKPPADAPKPQGNKHPDVGGGADTGRPAAITAHDTPERKRPMTRAEAVAAMEAERKAKSGGGAKNPAAAKPTFLPSGFGRRR